MKFSGIVAVSLSAMSLCSGCLYRATTIHAPDIDASAAADEAMSLYDSNQDGVLNEKELQACPGMLSAIEVYDGNKDRQISEDEIAQRVESWKEQGPAMMSVEYRVTLDGRPLTGATVQFVPEPYLQETLRPGSGTTDAQGMVSISLAPEDLPKQLQRVKLMNSGTYKVAITHPTAKIPEKYNTSTIIGREVSKQTTPSPYDEFKLITK